MNIPEGYVLVPVDPIKAIDMGWAYLDAAREAEPNKSHSFSHAGYRAMVAAAPPVELPAYDEAKEHELFEAFWSENMNLVEMDLHRHIYPMNSGWSYACHETNRAWMTLQACAKTRDRSAK